MKDCKRTDERRDSCPLGTPKGLAQDSLDDAPIAGQADDQDDDAGDADGEREVPFPGPLIVCKWEGSRERARC